MRRSTRGCGKPPGGPTAFSRKTRTTRHSASGGYEHIWSVRINEQYRAVAERHGDSVVWVWIGSHNDFDKLFG